MKTKKFYKGEKYVYLLMAYTLAKNSENKKAVIGGDNGYKGGQDYYRVFKIDEYDGKVLLIEKKNNASFADLTRIFEVIENNSPTPGICDYINEAGDNCGVNWYH